MGARRHLETGWDNVRRLVYFLLGVGLIVDAIVQRGSNVAELVAGLVLLGLIPIEVLVARAGRRGAG